MVYKKHVLFIYTLWFESVITKIKNKYQILYSSISSMPLELLCFNRRSYCKRLTVVSNFIIFFIVMKRITTSHKSEFKACYWFSSYPTVVFFIIDHSWNERKWTIKFKAKHKSIINESLCNIVKCYWDYVYCM